MTDTEPSPHCHHQMRSSRPTATPSTNPVMAPFLSPPIVSTPHTQHPPSQQQNSSPNYFGYQSDSNAFLSESPRHVRNNWSPPSSAVRSTVAMSPSFVPVDQNPEFDAFRRQSDSNKVFAVGGLNAFKMGIPSQRPNVDRTLSDRTTASQASTSSIKSRSDAKDVPSSSYRTQLELCTSDLSRSPKRMLSSGALSDVARRGSPANYTDPEEPARKSPKESSDSFPRCSLPLDSIKPPNGAMRPRMPAAPETNNSPPQDFVLPERVVSLLSSRSEDVLLLDLRVSTQYATAHISGALSLCIPTTLLKRPTFDVRKLADTFRDDQQRRRFENWRNASFIIVYDASSSSLKDANTCSNTIKKFRSEGYQGTLNIIKGGFAGFSKRFPSHVERGVDAQNTVEGDGPEVAPVVGGCPMPRTNNAANPFFGNIRQNMDLIGGVGQIALKHPTKATSSMEAEYPSWLKDASREQDQGKQVSHLFEQIERREKKRMEDALSGTVSYGTPGPSTHGAVQIAGLEKGSKNRYNNIWPFEHSRVKLQGVANHGCDYFNASHIKSSLSHKSYISTQAPIPATFNDFWNVVWQQDVRVIVMLTAEKEGAQVKAHNYWNQKQFGPLHLNFLSEKRASLELSRIHKHQKRPAHMQRHSTLSSNPQIPAAPLEPQEDKNSEQPYVIVRKFTLKHEKQPFEPMREITQLQYSGWPDFGAPAHPAHLLGLVEQCDAVVRATNKTRSADPEPPHKRPILVHCSAGCGRTGTFCTVDSVIDMLKRQRLSRAAHHEDEATASSSQPMDIDDDEEPSSKRNAHASTQSNHHSAAHKLNNHNNTASTMSSSNSNDFFIRSSHAPAKSAESSPDSVDGPWVDRDDQDLVAKTVEDFRLQRLSMVQSLRQFVLCYESIMEWLVEQSQEDDLSSSTSLNAQSAVASADHAASGTAPAKANAKKATMSRARS